MFESVIENIGKNSINIRHERIGGRQHLDDNQNIQIIDGDGLVLRNQDRNIIPNDLIYWDFVNRYSSICHNDNPPVNNNYLIDNLLLGIFYYVLLYHNQNN